MDPVKVIYNSNSYTILLFLHYTLSKHKANLLLPSVEGPYASIDELFVVWRCDPVVGVRRIIFPDYYTTEIKAVVNDPSQRFIAFPLILMDKHQCNVKSVSNESHMTMVIYDKKYKYIEFFDPTSNSDLAKEYNIELIPTVLVNAFHLSFGLGVLGMVDSGQICPRGGIQLLQEKEIRESNTKGIIGGNIGFCSIFSVMYLDERLQNPDLNPPQVIELIIDAVREHETTLTDLVTQYTLYLLDQSEQIERDLDSVLTTSVRGGVRNPKLFARFLEDLKSV